MESKTRKVILYIAMSLDGYIADKTGSVDWLSSDGSDNDNHGTYQDFIETVDTVIMGYKTYDQIVTELSPDAWAYPGIRSYVITHGRYESSDEICFTDAPLPELISELKSMEGKNIWICGGASIVNQLIEADLIDQFCITVIPTILGNGMPLFSEHEKELQLKLISACSYNGMTELLYERR